MQCWTGLDSSARCCAVCYCAWTARACSEAYPRCCALRGTPCTCARQTRPPRRLADEGIANSSIAWCPSVPAVLSPGADVGHAARRGLGLHATVTCSGTERFGLRSGPVYTEPASASAGRCRCASVCLSVATLRRDRFIHRLSDLIAQPLLHLVGRRRSAARRGEPRMVGWALVAPQARVAEWARIMG